MMTAFPEFLYDYGRIGLQRVNWARYLVSLYLELYRVKWARFLLEERGRACIPHTHIQDSYNPPNPNTDTLLWHSVVCVFGYIATNQKGAEGSLEFFARSSGKREQTVRNTCYVRVNTCVKSNHRPWCRTRKYTVTIQYTRVDTIYGKVHPTNLIKKM